MAIDISIRDGIIGRILGYLLRSRFFHPRYHNFRTETMIEIRGTKLDMMLRERRIIKIRLHAIIMNTRTIIRIIVIHIIPLMIAVYIPIPCIHQHLIMIISQCHIAEKLIGKHIIPTSRSHGISPIDVQPVIIKVRSIIILVCLSPFIITMILPLIKAQIHPASIRKFMIQFRINVIKIIAVVLILIQKRTCDPIDIGAPARKAKRGMIFPNRTLQVYFAGQ